MRGAEPKVTLQVLQLSDQTIRVTPFKEGSALESTVKLSRTCPFHAALVAERARMVLGLLARANMGERGLLPRLVEAGRAIWVDLLPAFLKEKLQDARGRNLVLHLDRPLVSIPWELLHDGEEFLGRRFRIGRLVTLEGEGAPALQRRMAPPLSALVVADPCGDLPAAREEAAAVERLLEDASEVGAVTTLTGKVTLATMRDELPRHDLFHYAGHADVDPATGEAMLRLADGAFGSRLIGQLRGQLDFPGLVFLNACGSADEARRAAASAERALEGAAGVAAAFLLAGVRHVVGTLWEVRDEVARAFAVGFWRALGGGETVGAAMEAGQRAVTAAWGEDSLLWADHLLYGDPTWRIVPPGNLTFDDNAVLDGLQARYREDLAAADPERRLLAAAMLLRLGDRSVVAAIERDLAVLRRWLGPAATARERRQADLLVTALATAAGLEHGDDPRELSDPEVVMGLLLRLREG